MGWNAILIIWTSKLAKRPALQTSVAKDVYRNVGRWFGPFVEPCKALVGIRKIVPGTIHEKSKGMHL